MLLWSRNNAARLRLLRYEISLSLSHPPNYLLNPLFYSLLALTLSLSFAFSCALRALDRLLPSNTPAMLNLHAVWWQWQAYSACVHWTCLLNRKMENIKEGKPPQKRGGLIRLLSRNPNTVLLTQRTLLLFLLLAQRTPILKSNSIFTFCRMLIIFFSLFFFSLPFLDANAIILYIHKIGSCKARLIRTRPKEPGWMGASLPLLLQ